jgi:hypothetical protein
VAEVDELVARIARRPWRRLRHTDAPVSEEQITPGPGGSTQPEPPAAQPEATTESNASADDALLLTIPEQAAPVVRGGPTAPTPRRYTARFAIFYALLGMVLAGTIVAGVSVFFQSGPLAAQSWSSWQPARGSTAQVTSAIANHVSQQYRLGAGAGQLVGVQSEPLTYTSGTHKISIEAVAIRKKANSDVGIVFYPTTNTWADLLCGLGTTCSISTGQASVTRGRLVRREALEIALYTFKFAPSISSLVAYMPPPPGSTSQTLLYFQKANLTKELSQPLDQTLPLATPPLPSSPDTTEASTIDKLTIPSLYDYSLAQLQDGGLALVLAPPLAS